MWRLDDLRGANNYLDTNVLIYAFEGDEADNRRYQLGALFRDLAEGRAQASASVITRTEVLLSHPTSKRGRACEVIWSVQHSGREYLTSLVSGFTLMSDPKH